MQRLTVLYDATCGFCAGCRRWLESRPQLVRLDFLAAGSPAAEELFHDLAPGAADELMVVADNGYVYRGDRALIMCLWALARYRAWAERLARPAWRPHVRRAFEWLSANRKDLSRLLALRPDASETCRPEGCPPDAPAAARGVLSKP